ncbi:MAG: LapA family protein [Bacillota bacterium]|nr:LapA family protein [Clostridia bacterium]
MQLLLIFTLVFALGVAIFAVQNATPVEISFLFYRFQDISLVVVILASVLAGALIVFLLSLVKQISFFRKIRTLEKRIEFLEKELKTKEEAEKAQVIEPEKEDTPAEEQLVTKS